MYIAQNPNFTAVLEITKCDLSAQYLDLCAPMPKMPSRRKQGLSSTKIRLAKFSCSVTIARNFGILEKLNP